MKSNRTHKVIGPVEYCRVGHLWILTVFGRGIAGIGLSKVGFIGVGEG